MYIKFVFLWLEVGIKNKGIGNIEKWKIIFFLIIYLYLVRSFFNKVEIIVILDYKILLD